jgi:4-amino-4-deoxy-L-arabinose transferase-like glycosyltransferase
MPEDYDPRGILTSFRGPGFPTFLAFVYTLFGTGAQRLFFARLAQAILAATIAPLVYTLAIQAGYQERTARGAAVILVIYPLLIIYPLGLVTENLFVVLVTLALVLLLRLISRQRWYDAFLAGIMLGAAALTRSVISAFILLVLIWLWISTQEKSLALRNSAWLLLAFLAVTLPWSIRSSLIHERFVWLESSLGYNLYLGYHPISEGTFHASLSGDLIPILDDAERDRRGWQAAVGFIRADPERVPYLVVRKLGYFWGLDRRALAYFYSGGFFGHWPPWLLGLVMGLDAGPLVVLAPLALVGLICGPWDKYKTLLLLVIVYYCGVHSLILAEPRFHLPLLPVLAVLAAYALIQRPWVLARPFQRGLVMALVTVLVFNWSAEILRDWEILAQLFGPDGHHIGLSY